MRGLFASLLPPVALLTCSAMATILTQGGTTIQEEIFRELDADHNKYIDLSEFTTGVEAIQKKASLLSSLTSARQQTAPSRRKQSFATAFSSSVAMIVATEIGDKTFFIAAVLSMRNDRFAVFGGAIIALYFMTILSTMMGLVLPTVLPRQYTHIIGGILFLYFGVKLILDSRSMQANKVSDELEEVEEELLHNKGKHDDDDNEPNDLEENTGKKERVRNAVWKSIFVQSLTLTFLAEWGDRSQIATIALAAAKEPYGVTIGGCFGHTLCTGMAVLGGRMLASRISEKTVSFGGGCIFLLFGIHSLFFES